MQLFGKNIGLDYPPMVIAEISCNHEGDIEKLKNLVVQANEVGADAVKLQVYIADEMTLNVQSPDLLIREGPWKGQYIYDLYRKNEFPSEWVNDIFTFAKSFNIDLFASVFGPWSFLVLESVSCPVYKIASFEANDIKFIENVKNNSNKPMIVSTGMCSDEDIQRIYKVIDPKNSVLMHCVSAYPTEFTDCNLSRIAELRDTYNMEVGFSDHTMSMHKSAIAAVAMGASVLEKHFRGSSTQSDDDFFSLTPVQFKVYVQAAKESFEALRYKKVEREEENKMFRRSIYALKDIRKGDKFTDANIGTVRGPCGAAPHNYKFLLNRQAKRYYKAGQPIEGNETL